MKTKIIIGGIIAWLVCGIFSGCTEDSDTSSDETDIDILAVPENDGSTIYKKIGDEINITLLRAIACDWELDEFDDSVINLEQNFTWDYSTGRGGAKPGIGDPGKRTWIFEVVGQGETTLKYTSIFKGDKPFSVYSTYVLTVVVE
jgi:predicted secreted protein